MTARTEAPLCVVSLTYVVPLEDVDARMGEHVAWLERGYAEGLFLASGRKVPRTGGVILIRGHRAQVEALIATDPFVGGGLARAEVIEFTASMVADAMAAVL